MIVPLSELSTMLGSSSEERSEQLLFSIDTEETFE